MQHQKNPTKLLSELKSPGSLYQYCRLQRGVLLISSSLRCWSRARQARDGVDARTRAEKRQKQSRD